MPDKSKTKPVRNDKPEKPKPLKPVKLKLKDIYFNGAFLCENILHDQDGTMSFIRVLDKITIHGSVPREAFEKAAEVEAPVVGAYAFLIFKTSKKLDLDVQLFVYSPSGLQKAHISQPITSTEKWGGINFKLNIRLAVRELGLHWIEVKVNGSSQTMIPLHIEYSQLADGAVSQSPQ